MQITYFGHSTFLVKTNGKSILFDPFITPNPLASAIDIEKIIPDFMLISHGHNDHIADAEKIAKQSNCKVIGAWEITQWLESKGVSHIHPMNTGGGFDFDFGSLKLVNAVHSSTLPDGTPGGNPVGFVVQNLNDCFYFAGDTALTSDMQLIPRRFHLKAAFLPLGSNFTMDVYDAIEAAKMIQCNNIIAMHFDTFGYIKIDHAEAQNAFTRAGINLHIMDIGQTTEI
jgi:L-ascorbate metabolism protein UlaG (beta-lactamase superfamily)